MRAWGPVTNPTARALASWLCALWGRHEGARGGGLLPGCEASGDGRSPTPDLSSVRACIRGQLPTGCGCVGCGHGAVARVLGCVCFCVPAPLVPRHSCLACAVWVCVFGLRFRLRPPLLARVLGCVCSYPPAPPAYRGATEGPSPAFHVGSSEERSCPDLAWAVRSPIRAPRCRCGCGGWPPPLPMTALAE